MIEKSIKAYDGHIIHYFIWKAKSPKGILHILHGMREYKERYIELAEFLVENNFHVIAHDHRGHGLGIKDHQHGFFSKKEGWLKVIEDVKLVYDVYAHDYSVENHFFLGHSMGSFILRDFLSTYQSEIKVSGAIISGTAQPNTVTVNLALTLSKLLLRFQSHLKPSEFLEWLSFKGFNKRFKNSEVKSWLTGDKDKLEAFKKHPYAFKTMPIIFYKDLYTGLKRMIRKSAFNIKDIPLLFITGSDDPVSRYSKDISTVKNNYEEYTEVKSIIYEGFRHEPINEINRSIVFNDILSWLNNKR